MTAQRFLSPQSPFLQYLDTLDHLPDGITLAQIRANRELACGILCDYCFYGGPTKSVWLLTDELKIGTNEIINKVGPN